MQRRGRCEYCPSTRWARSMSRSQRYSQAERRGCLDVAHQVGTPVAGPDDREADGTLCGLHTFLLRRSQRAPIALYLATAFGRRVHDRTPRRADARSATGRRRCVRTPARWGASRFSAAGHPPLLDRAFPALIASARRYNVSSGPLGPAPLARRHAGRPGLEDRQEAQRVRASERSGPWAGSSARRLGAASGARRRQCRRSCGSRGATAVACMIDLSARSGPRYGAAVPGRAGPLADGERRKGHLVTVVRWSKRFGKA